MHLSETKLKDVFLIKPELFGDDRGYFFESFNKKKLEKALGRELRFIQDNESKSSYGVLRGFAFQKGSHAQAKLVRVLSGEILDVALDIRKNSPTFGKYVTHLLSSENKYQVFIPRGFAHAFITLSESATVLYKVDNAFHAESESGVIYNDDTLKVNWKINEADIKVSEKDLSRPTFNEVEYF